MHKVLVLLVIQIAILVPWVRIQLLQPVHVRRRHRWDRCMQKRLQPWPLAHNGFTSLRRVHCCNVLGSIWHRLAFYTWDTGQHLRPDFFGQDPNSPKIVHWRSDAALQHQHIFNRLAPLTQCPLSSIELLTRPWISEPDDSNNTTSGQI